MSRRPSFVVLSLAGLAACAHSSPGGISGAGPGAGSVSAPGTEPAEDIARARARGETRAFQWEPYAPEAFARAKREHKFILLDGAAEWCHWCHVMDETTYADPAVGRALADGFVAIRVDIDQRPDIAERYADWGWPATILFSPDAEELGKFRGYLPPEALLQALAGIRSAPRAGTAIVASSDPAAPVDALPWLAAKTTRDLDALYDEREGGWGMRQKAPLGDNVQFELRRATHGDAAAKQRALYTLDKQAALLDPVWGGIYQYSAARDWNSPHFEKLMTYQVPNAEAWASAYVLARDDAHWKDAAKIGRYMIDFLGAPDGTFYVNQDADLGAHDHGGRFVDGHVYYAKDDAGRRALGIPWIDKHVYARENGLAIAALVALHDASATKVASADDHDDAWLARARTAADAILKTHVLDDGTVLHDAALRSAPFFLSDAASFGRALALLAVATGEARYRERALVVAAAMERNFGGDKQAYFETSAADGAAGAFLVRQRPFSPNVTASRFLSALAKATGEARHRERAAEVLAGAATPSALDDQGRMVGEFLLALDEVGAVRW